MTVRATRLSPLNGLDPALDALRVEASVSGFLFLDRLEADWKSGNNRFDAPGEILLGAYVAEKLVGVGGLNRDPYEIGGSVGRIRHLYIAQSCRQHGVGSGLLNAILDHAGEHYETVRLRADTAAASQFYLRHGFEAIDHIWATHVRPLNARERRAARVQSMT